LTAFSAQRFGDFELLSLDDGSTDKSLDVTKRDTGRRLVLFRNQQNMGYVYSLKVIQAPRQESSLPLGIAMTSAYPRASKSKSPSWTHDVMSPPAELGTEHLEATNPLSTKCLPIAGRYVIGRVTTEIFVPVLPMRGPKKAELEKTLKWSDR